MRNYLILFILLSATIWGYDFSKVIPQNTMMYLTIDDVQQFEKDFTTKKWKTLLETTEVKKIIAEYKKYIALRSSDKNLHYTKDEFYDELEKLMEFPFAYTMGMDKLLNPIYAFLVKGKKANDIFLKSSEKLLQPFKKKGLVKLEKTQFKGVNITTVLLKNKKVDKKKKPRSLIKNKKETQKPFTYSYAIVDDTLILTTSQDYIKILIHSLKAKALPKLSENIRYQRAKRLAGKSTFFFYLDLKMILNLLLPTKDNKALIKQWQLNELDNLISFYDTSKQDKKIFIKLLSKKRKFPEVYERATAKGERIEIPMFLLKSSYSLASFKVDLGEFYKESLKNSSKKEKHRLERLENSIGQSFNRLISDIGTSMFLLNVEHKKESEVLFIFKHETASQLIRLVKGMLNNPVLGLSHSAYLDGDLFSITGNVDLLGYGLGQKNNYFMFGKLELIKEMMQNMKGKSEGFRSSKPYKHLMSHMSKKEFLLISTQLDKFFYFFMNSLKKEIDKTMDEVLNAKEMKASKQYRKLVHSLARLSPKFLKKYLPTLLIRGYIEKDELVIELKY